MSGVATLALLFLAASAPTVPLEQGWQYRWGDHPSWATDPWDAPGWQTTSLPGQPPKSATPERWLWMRVQVPRGGWREPALKLDGVVGHFELFLEGERLYVHPSGGVDAKGSFGMPWHLVTLPPGSEGKTIALRSRTSYFLAGVVGRAELGERSQLIEAVVRKDLLRAVVGVLLVMMGLLALLVLIPAGARRLAAGLGLWSMSAGIYTLHYTQLKQLAVDIPPVLWFLGWMFSVALLPIGMLRYVLEAFEQKPRHLQRFLRVHEWAAGAYAATALLGWAALATWGAPAEPPTTTVFVVVGGVVRVLLFLSSAAVIWHIVQIARSAPVGERFKARILLVGVGAVFAVVIPALGASFGVSRYGAAADVYLGLLCFAIALAVVAGRVWSEARLRAIEFAGQLEERSKEKEAMLRDLHDGIGGVTTNIRLLAELGKRDGGRAADALVTIAELSTEGLAELRAFTQTLEDASVTWPVLCSELRRYGGQMIESQGKTFSMNTEVQGGSRPSSVLSLAVLRVFREALTNIVKHADATRVDVVLSVDHTHFSLSIADDGAGGGSGGGLDTGRGVANMRARAKELGGELTLSKGAGTQLLLRLPIPRNSPGSGAEASLRG